MFNTVFLFLFNIIYFSLINKKKCKNQDKKDEKE